MALRRTLLRPRPGREPDQAAQGPARLRPHLLPASGRQPDAARPAHRSLLADAHRARRHPGQPSPRQGRVHDDPAAPAQARRPHSRDRCPRPPRLRRRLPRGRPAAPPCDRARPSPGLNGGAVTPRRTRSHPSNTDATFRIHTRHSGRAIPRAVSPKHVVSQAPVNKTG